MRSSVSQARARGVLDRLGPDVAAVLGLVVGHAALAFALRSTGFDHISDDDFARVTIAQAFVHAPRLDPSGTSWLPFPFWALGGALLVFGRSLDVARVVSIILSSLATSVPYAALRSTGATPGRAALAVAFAVASPWSLWLGAATVPESFTASLATAAAIGLGSGEGPCAGPLRGPAARSSWPALGLALGMMAACLSRYEAWPVAATLAGLIAWRSVRGFGGSEPRSRRSTLIVHGGVTAVLVAGPLVWMLWNAHAHGSPTHFFDRVSQYKRAIGEGSRDTVEALLFYPRILFAMRPDVVAAALCALLLFGRTPVRKRWGGPLACALAQLVFLAIGNARDGAPAHHPERALLGIVFLLAMMAVDVLGSTAKQLEPRARRPAWALAFALVLGWGASLRGFLSEAPGTSAAEDRRAQIARGTMLSQAGAREIAVTPCAFEHFALIAAYAAPENVIVRPKGSEPRAGDCPAVRVLSP